MHSYIQSHIPTCHRLRKREPSKASKMTSFCPRAYTYDKRPNDSITNCLAFLSLSAQTRTRANVLTKHYKSLVYQGTGVVPGICVKEYPALAGTRAVRSRVCHDPVWLVERRKQASTTRDTWQVSWKSLLQSENEEQMPPPVDSPSKIENITFII